MMKCAIPMKLLPTLISIFAALGVVAALAKEIPPNLETRNLAAWCIVPFDAAKRNPAERAKMLSDLGIRRCAYDWRDEHIPEFEEEIIQYRKHGIEFFAFWGGHEEAFRLFEKHEIRPQIWQTLGSPTEGTQHERVTAAADSMEEIAKRTATLGCKLGLYNHGGWGGEPANLIEVCEEMRKRGHHHVGIVYNWHHAHDHIADWPDSLARMKPYLICLNLNGMNDGASPKILSLAQGTHDLAMLRTVIESGYDGPIGIIDHQEHLESKQALLDNINGLEWLKRELMEPKSGGEKPTPKATTHLVPPTTIPSLAPAFGRALSTGLVVDGNSAWRNPPITVECRVKLHDAKGYNILLASDPKTSSSHWEIFAMDGTGCLSVYLPGATPDHVRSEATITDGAWHAVAMQYAPDRVRLWLDGKLVADQTISIHNDRQVIPGGLGLARLVEGGLTLRGAIDEVRIRTGIHDDLSAPADSPFGAEAPQTIGYWDFEKPGDLSIFTPDRKPLDPTANPHWQHPINRDRLYDFYAKQAIHFSQLDPAEIPVVLPRFSGLDGGTMGHWGNQNEDFPWKDPRVRETDHGSMISGVFRGAGQTIPRAVCVRLEGGINTVFDQQSLRFELAWKGDFVKWSDVRHGLLHGITIGSDVFIPIRQSHEVAKDARYLGLTRNGNSVTFSYLENGQTKHLTATVSNGELRSEITSSSPTPGITRWPVRPVTRGSLGTQHPYAIDTLTLPYDNPWKSLFFVSGVDFLTPARIAICTIHGDVWLCDVSSDNLSELRWKRFAAGLHQPLGLKVADGIIHVMARDQIVALHDHNGDDEADEYACISNAHNTSPGGHDFITGLERDHQGRWYFASGNQGLYRTSADGQQAEILSTGFRNPNGLGITPDASVILTSVQEGNWTPASAICEIIQGGHFGAGGPQPGDLGNLPPMLYLPRGADNSSGGQTFIDSSRWGPLAGKWIHYSHGFGSHFLILREKIGDHSQAAAVPLPGDFLSGSHRGRFSPHDGQLYVVGSQGWGSYGPEDGCLHRVRFTGDPFHYPIAHESRDNGILLHFAEPTPPDISVKSHWFAQQWNYLHGPAYGSSEYSVKHPDHPGHDPIDIRSVHRLGDGTRVFIEMPQLEPVHQLHLHFNGSPRIELFATIHHLGQPFTDFQGYTPIAKSPTVTAPVTPAKPAEMIQACIACHHPTQQLVGPPLTEIRQRYAGNPDGIVKWAMDPQIRNPQLPPMPSFKSLGEKNLRAIAERILAGE